MAARKTIPVEQVRDWVNTALAIPGSPLVLDGLTPEQAFRFGVASLLEQVLHATGNYQGYNHLRSEYLPADEQTADKVLRDGYDNTRRRYY